MKVCWCSDPECVKRGCKLGRADGKPRAGKVAMWLALLVMGWSVMCVAVWHMSAS